MNFYSEDKSLEKLIKDTQAIFDSGIFNSPVCSPQDAAPEWKKRNANINELIKANLLQQAAKCMFEMQCWRIESLGFKRFSKDNLVKILMGEAHTHLYKDYLNGFGENIFDHTSAVLPARGNTKWIGGYPDVYSRKERLSFWSIFKTEIWEVKYGPIKYFNCDFSYKTLVKINTTKAGNYFNTYRVLAPKSLWHGKESTYITPFHNLSLLPIIIVGTIYPMGVSDNDNNNPVDYFLTHWDQ